MILLIIRITSYSDILSGEMKQLAKQLKGVVRNLFTNVFLYNKKQNRKIDVSQRSDGVGSPDLDMFQIFMCSLDFSSNFFDQGGKFFRHRG